MLNNNLFGIFFKTLRPETSGLRKTLRTLRLNYYEAILEFENYHINITFEKNYSNEYSNQFLSKKLQHFWN